jgi:transposase, IS5 family
VRADTTVVAANVCYPTDAGLLARAIGKLHTTIGRIQAAGAATRTRVRDRRRSARRRAHQLAKTLRARSEQAKQLVLRTTGELATFAEQAVGDAAWVADNAHRVLAARNLARRIDELATTIQRTSQIVAQIRTGWPAVKRITARAGRTPKAVTADRGCGEAAVNEELHALRVEWVAIPRKGQPGRARQATEHTRGFRRLVKWRTGCKGRISHLKHRFGWDRTLMDGIDGARIWCGQGVLAHNLVKISGLIQAKQAG